MRLLEDRLQLSAAFRAQFFSLQQPKFTPLASAPYSGIAFQSPPTAYTGDGSIAYMFRVPARSYVLTWAMATARPHFMNASVRSSAVCLVTRRLGDPRLAPDRSIAVDGGVDQTLFGNRMRASATYFYTRLQQIIIFDFSGVINPATDPFGRFGGYRTTSGGIARGVELSVTATPSRNLNLSVAYTLTKSQQRTPQVAGVLRTLLLPIINSHSWQLSGLVVAS